MSGQRWWLFLGVLMSVLSGCREDKATPARLGTAKSAGEVEPVCEGGGAASATLSFAPGSGPFGRYPVSATVSSQSGPRPTGTVTFSSDNGASCTIALHETGVTSSTASVDFVPVCTFLFTPNEIQLSAVYNGDATYHCQASSSWVYISPAETETTLTPPAFSAAVYGQPTQFEASVGYATGNSHPLSPAGEVDLVDVPNDPQIPAAQVARPGKGIVVYTTGLGSGGTARMPVAGNSPPLHLEPGPHHLYAGYRPNPENWYGSSSDTFDLTITTAQSSLGNVTVSPTPALEGETIELRTTVSAVAPSEVIPDGSVAFYYVPREIAETGDWTQIELNASWACSTEIFSQVNVGIGSAACEMTGAPVGDWAAYAVFTPNDNGHFSSSMSDDLTDFDVDLEPRYVVTLTKSPSSAEYGTKVTFTATVQSKVNETAPTGDVRFYRLDAPTTPIATVALVPGETTSSATTPELLWLPGLHEVRAVFDGEPVCPDVRTFTAGPDCEIVPSSDTEQIIISKRETTTTLGVAYTGSPSAAAYGQTITLTAHTEPKAPNAGLAPLTGTVLFLAGECGSAPAGVVTPVPTCTPLGSRPIDAGDAVLHVASLPKGTHKLWAVSNADNVNDTYLESRSGSSTVTVVSAPTSATVTSSANPAISGADVTLSATIVVAPPATVGGDDPASPPASGLEGGSVVFRDGSTVLGTGVLDPTQNTSTHRVYKLTRALTGAGDHPIRAEYSGNDNYLGTTSPAYTQKVDRDGVFGVVVSSLNPSPFGSSVTFTATLSATTGTTPTGTITFADSGAVFGTPTLVNGVASATLSGAAPGIHAITVGYNGDPTHLGGPIATLTQTVTAAPVTLALTASPNPSVAGQPVSFTATLTSPAALPITGNVVFKDGGTTLGTVALANGTATLTTSTLAVGPHNVTATYAGNASFGSAAKSVTSTVNKGASELTVSSSLNPSFLGRDVTLTATVVAVAPATGKPSGLVRFLRGTQAIGSVPLTAAGTASLTTKNLLAGANALTVKYEGDARFSASEGSFTQNAATDVSTVALTAAPSPSTFGQSVTISATVSGASGTPTGTVTFKYGATTLGTQPLTAGGFATLTTMDLPVGSLTLTAEYGGDATYVAGSASASHVVDKASTIATIAASPNPALAGETITFDATVTSAAGPPGGDIEVKNGATVLGTATLAGGRATYSTTAIPAGTHTVTITYKGDATFAASSTTLTLTVNDPANANSSSGAAGGSSGIPSITPGSGGDGGDDCSVSNVGAHDRAGFGAGLGLLIGFVALARRRRAA